MIMAFCLRHPHVVSGKETQMPLDKLVLIIVIVIAAAGATIWIGMALTAALALSPTVALAFLIPIAGAAYIAWRIIGDRINNSEDDHYDRIEK